MTTLTGDSETMWYCKVSFIQLKGTQVHTEGAFYHNQNQFSKVSWKQAHCILQNTSFGSFWHSDLGSWGK